MSRSIEDILNTDCYSEFSDNFEMFLRKHKDKNPSQDWQCKLKFEQRYDFVVLTACVSESLCKPDYGMLPSRLAEVGRRFYPKAKPESCRWSKDLLQGFDKTGLLLAHLKDIHVRHADGRKVDVKIDLLLDGFRWVVDLVNKTLEEFKTWREGLDKVKRETWDKMVKERLSRIAREEGCSSSEDEGVTSFDAFTKKEMEDRGRLQLEKMFPGWGEGSAGGRMLGTRLVGHYTFFE